MFSQKNAPNGAGVETYYAIVQKRYLFYETYLYGYGSWNYGLQHNPVKRYRLTFYLRRELKTLSIAMWMYLHKIIESGTVFLLSIFLDQRSWGESWNLVIMLMTPPVWLNWSHLSKCVNWNYPADNLVLFKYHTACERGNWNIETMNNNRVIRYHFYSEWVEMIEHTYHLELFFSYWNLVSDETANLRELKLC